MISARHTAILAILLGAAACGDDGEGFPDAMIRVDGAVVDATLPPDAPADAPAVVDGAPADAPAAPDATPTDATPAPDGTPIDAIPAPDAGPADALPAPDAGPADAAPVPDAGPADAAPVPDAGPADAAPVPDAGPADATPADATPPLPDAGVGSFEVSAGAGPITTWQFTDTAMGSQDGVDLTITNRGGVSIGPVGASIAGTHASDFTIDGPVSTCVGATLAAGASCNLVVRFAPSLGGLRGAMLTITGVPAAPAVIALSGRGIGRGLVASPAALVFGDVEGGTTPTRTVAITNTDGTPTSLATSVSGAGFSRQSTTCGATLGSGATCQVVVAYAPTALGTQSGSLLLDATVDVTVPLTARGVGRLTVTVAGTGAGTVRSTPAGVTCPTTCSALFAASPTLTAEPNPTSTFTGWSRAECGAATTCVVPVGVAATAITATFAARTTATLEITFAGDATGEVSVAVGDSISEVCSASCTVSFDPNTAVSLVATTPSGFGGWGGACAGTDPQCTLTLAAGTTAVTATFDRADGEQWTRLLVPGGTILSADYDGQGNLIVGTSAGLFKLTGAGADIWSLPSAIGKARVDPAGDIFVLSPPNIIKVSAAGAVLWTRDAGLLASIEMPRMAHRHAVAPNGDVLVMNHSVRAWSGAGTHRWTATVSRSKNVVEVDAAGVVHVAADDPADPDITIARRYASDGTPLGESARLGAQYWVAFDLDSMNNYVMSSSGHSRLYYQRTSQAGATVGAHTLVISDADYVENGIAVDAFDHAVSVYELQESASLYGGFAARRFGTTGGVIGWSIARPPVVLVTGFNYGHSLYGIGADSTGNVALVGRYGSQTYDGGWIQVFRFTN